MKWIGHTGPAWTIKGTKGFFNEKNPDSSGMNTTTNSNEGPKMIGIEELGNARKQVYRTGESWKIGKGKRGDLYGYTCAPRILLFG